MLLKEKQNLFLSDAPLPVDASIAKETLKLRGISKETDLIAEKNASLESPIIGKGKIFIGAFSYMNGDGYIRADSNNKVFIGRFCSIGRRVTIAPGMHNMTGISTNPALNSGKGEKYSPEQEVSICKRRVHGATIIDSDVWIGDGAIIMPGVHIGIGSVVAANAVVTKDVAPYQIVGGVPAKVIKTRFGEQLSKKLVDSRWWEMDYEILKSMPIKNVFEFLNKADNKLGDYNTYKVK
jgi:acetyltransferase-like isoleucine patch superfamily enzyme